MATFLRTIEIKYMQSDIIKRLVLEAMANESPKFSIRKLNCYITAIKD